MIYLDVVASSSGPHHKMPQFSQSYWTQSCTIPPAYVALGTSEGAGTFEIEQGSLEQDRGRFGQLRDTGVKHLNSSGNLSVVLDSYKFGMEQPSGAPTEFPFGQLANGTHVPYSGLIEWGQPYSRVDTWTPLPYKSGSYTYTVQEAYRFDQEALFDGDKFILTNIYYVPVIYRNGNQYRPASIMATLYGYRRDSANGFYSINGVNLNREPNGTDYSNLMDTLIPPSGILKTATGLVQGNAITPELAYSYVSSAVDAEFRSMSLFITEQDVTVDFGELALECAQQLRYVDQNILGMMFDVTEWRSLQGLCKVLTNAAPWRRSAEAVARALNGKSRAVRSSSHHAIRNMHDMLDPASSVYLGVLYGVLPTVSDLKRLTKGLLKFLDGGIPFQRLHSRKVTNTTYPGATFGEHTAVLTVEVAPFPTDMVGKAMEFIAKAKRWGLYPEMSNLWDRVPLSFASDWIVQFGGLFDDCNDYMDQMWYFPIRLAIMSEKWTMGKDVSSMVPENVPVTGIVEFSYYRRWISGSIPLPSVSLTAESQLGNHSAEATALMFQRLRV